MLISMYLYQVGKFLWTAQHDATVGVKELGLIYMKVTCLDDGAECRDDSQWWCWWWWWWYQWSWPSLVVKINAHDKCTVVILFLFLFRVILIIWKYTITMIVFIISKLHCSVKVYRCLGCPETFTLGTASLQIELHPHGWLISTRGRGRLNARQWPCERTSALYTVYSSFFKQGSDISHVKEQARYTLCTHRPFLQRSDMSHAKEQAP